MHVWIQLTSTLKDEWTFQVTHGIHAQYWYHYWVRLPLRSTVATDPDSGV